MALGRVLAVLLLAVAFLGAAEAGFVGSPSDVYVRNDDETTRTVTVEVVDPGVFGVGGGTVAETQATLQPGEAVEVGGVIELNLVVVTLNAHDILVKENGRTVSATSYGGCRAVGVYLQEMSYRYNCFHTDPCGSDNPFAERAWC